MGFTASFLMALALSVDALVCAVITGKKQFPPALRLRFALEMGLTFGLFQALMPIAGFYAGASLAALIAAFDHWAAFALLSVVGLKMLKDALFPEKEECCQKAPRLSLTLLMTLGIATSIDALALGFSIGLISDTIALFASVVGVTCFVISCGGFMIGQILASFTKLDRLLNAAGGLVLLGIGIKILYEHQAFDLIFD